MRVFHIIHGSNTELGSHMEVSDAVVVESEMEVASRVGVKPFKVSVGGLTCPVAASGLSRLWGQRAVSEKRSWIPRKPM